MLARPGVRDLDYPTRAVLDRFRQVGCLGFLAVYQVCLLPIP